MPLLPPPSLRHKILLGYVAIGLLILGLSLATLMDLRQLEQRIDQGSRVTDFLNATLELRRYEKNYFLYHQEEDLAAFRAWLEQARALSREESLQAYGSAMDRYVAAPGQTDLEQAVRQRGKLLATRAEAMAATEKRELFQTLETHRHALIIAIVLLMLVMLAAGRILAQMVTRPLKAMEQTMRQVAEGEIGPIALPSRDREILSLTQAFNRMLMELHARQKHLVRSEKLASLGTMLSGVAHELNNPLSNIATSAQILLEEPDLPPFHRELLEQIDEQTLRARHIVRSLLDFARNRPFLREPVAVAPLVEESLRLLRSQMGTGIAVEVQVGHGVTVHADRQRLQQALINLIKNGADAMHDHGTLRISARSLPEAQQFDLPDPQRLVAGNTYQCRVRPVVEIVVEDNGDGIDPQLLPRILDPFFTTKETGQGSGLGLFVTHEIVEEHGGCLVVDSRPGNGSRFRMLLPLEHASEKENRP